LESTPQTKPRDEILVAGLVCILQKVQEAPPTIDHAEQALA
jgi:hypothetical protein